MSTEAKTRSFCRECGQQTWHMIAASINRDEVEVETDPGERPVLSENVYELLQCCGCECVTMRCTTTCEELYRDDTVVRHVNLLPAQSQLLQVPISWSGQDDVGGSGVASFDIYFSDNCSGWTNWLSATTGTNAIFQGKPQHTYGFYSRAHDNAGNIEAAHLTADTTTTVVANPLFQLTVTPTATNLNINDTFTYTIKVKNSGSLTLNNVVLSNTMPAGVALDYVSYGRGSATIGDSWILWAIGNMATNLTATMSVTADAVVDGTWTNFFTVADSDGASASTALELIQVGPLQTPPVISVARAGQQVVLSWPPIASNYHLESVTNLMVQTNWNAVSDIPAIVNGQNTVTQTINSPKTYYRLRNP